MTPQQKPRNATRLVLALLIVVSAVGIWAFLQWQQKKPPATVEKAAPIATPTPSQATSTADATTGSASSTPVRSAVSQPTPDPARALTFETFRTRPFEPSEETASHAWTSEDGRDPDVIFEIAHNELEAQRMLDENDTIKRRQLVYRKETVPMLVQRAIPAGEPLKTITLPGFNGREIEVEVTKTDIRNMEMGSVIGRVKGRFNSIVSVGFSDGRESFNIISPEDGLYLVADAREPGEVILKEIDPETYAVPPDTDAPDFILTGEPVPGQKPDPDQPPSQ